MSSGAIFASVAANYYAKGLQVIPLKAMDKRPFLDGWQTYSNAKVTPEEQQKWIASYPNGNIGLVLGQVSNVCVIDIDIEDENLVNEVIAMLPHSPWHRKGRKGMVLAYRYTPMKTARIRTREGETMVEILTNRVQVVLPPSIHPDTRQPYISNCELYDVVDQLKPLPEDIEDKIREFLVGRGFELSTSGWSKLSDYVPAGSRDVTMTKRAGALAYAVVRGEMSLKKAIDILVTLANDFTEKVVGDPIDLDKHIGNLVKFIMNDVRDRKRVLPVGWDEDLTDEDKKGFGLNITEEERAWESGELRNWIVQKGREACGSEDAEYEFIDKALSFISRSSNLTAIQVDQALNAICGNVQMQIKPSTLRTRIREMKQGEIAGQDQTEVAQHVISSYNQESELRYADGKYYQWGGSHWEHIEEQQIMSKISRDYGHLPVVKRNNDIVGVCRVMALNCAGELCKTKLTGVNFANGFLTSELELIPHDPDHGCIYTLPYRYLPEEAGNFPRFSKFLEDCWGSDPDYQQKVAALQEAMAATLFGEAYQFQRAFLLQGAGQTGKSQLLRIIEELVPEAGRSAVPPEDWSDKFIPARMYAKILNVCGELSERATIDGKKFKEIVDGTVITSQYKFGAIFDFRPVCAHWFCSNPYPKSRDTSNGFLRRWLILKFNKIVQPHERVIDLGAKIVAEEREAICAWAVAAIVRLRNNRNYTLPQSHIDTVNIIACQLNSVRDFLCNGRTVTLKGGVSISDSDLYALYWEYCIGGGGRKPEPQGKFREIMAELCSEFGIHVAHTNPDGRAVTIEYVGLGKI